MSTRTLEEFPLNVKLILRKILLTTFCIGIITERRTLNRNCKLICFIKARRFVHMFFVIYIVNEIVRNIMLHLFLPNSALLFLAFIPQLPSSLPRPETD